MTQRKNMKLYDQYLDPWELEGSVEDAKERLSEAAKGIEEARIEWTDFGESFRIKGWVPMTAKEIAQAKRRRESAQKAALVRKQKQEEIERHLYEKLRLKYGEEK